MNGELVEGKMSWRRKYILLEKKEKMDLTWRSLSWATRMVVDIKDEFEEQCKEKEE